MGSLFVSIRKKMKIKSIFLFGGIIVALILVSFYAVNSYANLVENELSIYGDDEFDAIMKNIAPDFEAVTGVKVFFNGQYANEPRISAVTQDLSSPIPGAARLRNWDNSGQREIFLGIPDLGVGGNRVESDYVWSTGVNHIRFGYDAVSSKEFVEVGPTPTRLEYTVGPGVEYDTVQFMVLNRAGGSTDIRLQNILVNGISVDGTLVGDSSWPKWNLEGPIKDTNGGFVVEADLVLATLSPNGESNKVEILFGTK